MLSSGVAGLRATWCLRHWLLRAERQMHSSHTQPLLCHQLTSRGVVRLSGRDTFPFLQGLITNDAQTLRHMRNSIYSLMLNVQGRVLYDMLLYKGHKSEDSTVLVECDKEILTELLTAFKGYKIRKKVDMADVSSEYKAWSILPQESMMADKTSLNLVSKEEDEVIFTHDPRITAFGWRLILPSGLTAMSVVEGSGKAVDSSLYDRRRFQIGLAEGTTELPPGNCLPLESNVVFLNGVSFSKGCYIGQELTARTHHTGVTRKRIMPLKFQSESCSVSINDVVENSAGKNVGKVRQRRGQHGLGLLRINNVLGKEQGKLIVRDSQKRETGMATTFMPEWWHQDSDELLKQISSQNKT